MWQDIKTTVWGILAGAAYYSGEAISSGAAWTWKGLIGGVILSLWGKSQGDSRKPQ